MSKSSLPFGFDKPEESPGFLLWQTTTLWQRRIKKALEEHGVSHAQFVIMASLLYFAAHKQSTTQVFLANQTKMDKMTVSKALKGLTAMGYTSRSEDKLDTRAKNVTLTKAGQDMVKKLVPIVEDIDSEFFGPLKTAEQRELIHLFRKIIL